MTTIHIGVPAEAPHIAWARGRQRGASLFIALVTLAILTIAGVALVRSVDTGNLIAGNFAFKNATVHAADVGIEAALTYLNGTVALTPDSNLPDGCSAGACRYYARAQAEGSDGIPTGIDWNHANLAPASVGGYSVRYVIDRLCNPSAGVSVALGTNPVVDAAAPLCYTTPVDPKSSKKGGIGPGVSSTAVEVFYRVTVRVTGPRDTVTMLQTILGRTN